MIREQARRPPRGSPRATCGARRPALASDELGRLGRALNLVAERQATQIDALTSSRDELETVLDSVADGLIAIDADDLITHLNPEAIRMFDAPRDAVGRPFWEIARDAIACRISSARSSVTGAPAEGSLTLAHSRRGATSRCASRRRGARTSGWSGAVLVFRDVTRLHRLEAVRRDFVANVSHEMKTPLTSIQGYVETLLAGALEDPAVAHDFLEKIDRNSRNLGHLVTDLLVLSRVEAGGIQVDPEPFPRFRGGQRGRRGVRGQGAREGPRAPRRSGAPRRPHPRRPRSPRPRARQPARQRDPVHEVGRTHRREDRRGPTRVSK